ncbi:MAG: NifB/NifX family molybdenum-iron cluster-binding protein [Alistipes sp.]|nr:NifB/NifX family molybdenum-iron cluster-binding protein [Alistipes sp.]
MKIAVPTREGVVDNHFGHCDHYTIYTVEGGQIVGSSTLPSPQGCGCKSGIALTLQQMGVEVMLAGNMGEGAKSKLESHNIRVIRGCSGDVQVVAESFLRGYIFDSGVGCSVHHECADK